MTIEIAKGDVDLEVLANPQRQGEQGWFARSMSAYLRWLAPQVDEFKTALRERFAKLRADARESVTQHDRTPEQVASLFLGWGCFIESAQASDAVTKSEASGLTSECWTALLKVAQAQSSHQTASNPVARFFELLAEALGSGHAHVADTSGKKPEEATRWAWRTKTVGGLDNERDDWQPQGVRIGWVDGGSVYVNRQASGHEVAQRMAGAGDHLPISPVTLTKRVREQGLLFSWDPGRLTCRKTLEGGVREKTLHVSAESPVPSREPGQVSRSRPGGPLGPENDGEEIELDEEDP